MPKNPVPVEDDNPDNEEEDSDFDEDTDDSEFIEAFTQMVEDIDTLKRRVDSADKGYVLLTRSFVTVLADVVVATNPSVPEEARKAATERIQRIVAAMQQTLGKR